MIEKEYINQRRISESNLKSHKNRRKNQKLIKRFNKLLLYDKQKRYRMIKKIFFKVGPHCSIYPPFYCDYGQNIVVGDYFFANVGCIILDTAQVIIGSHVMLGPGVKIITATHPIDHKFRNTGCVAGQSIIIGDNVWIGANAVINPGVQIGNNTVIGSGSVVTNNISSNVLAAGNPCKIIRKI